MCYGVQCSVNADKSQTEHPDALRRRWGLLYKMGDGTAWLAYGAFVCISWMDVLTQNRPAYKSMPTGGVKRVVIGYTGCLSGNGFNLRCCCALTQLSALALTGIGVANN